MNLVSLKALETEEEKICLSPSRQTGTHRMLYTTCLKKGTQKWRFYRDDHVRRGGHWNMVLSAGNCETMSWTYCTHQCRAFIFEISMQHHINASLYYYLVAKPRPVQALSRESPLSPQMQQPQLKSAGRVSVRATAPGPALLVFLKSLLLGNNRLFRAINPLIMCQTTTASISLQYQQNLSVSTDRFYPATAPPHPQ